jgi:hypothetical protein
MSKLDELRETVENLTRQSEQVNPPILNDSRADKARKTFGVLTVDAANAVVAVLAEQEARLKRLEDAAPEAARAADATRRY